MEIGAVRLRVIGPVCVDTLRTTLGRSGFPRDWTNRVDHRRNGVTSWALAAVTVAARGIAFPSVAT